jgi:glycerol-3-phosphate dehydrogenase
MPDFTQREIRFIAEAEQVEHLSDLVLRRAPIALGGRLTQALAETLADLVGEIKDWGAIRRKQEQTALGSVA